MVVPLDARTLYRVSYEAESGEEQLYDTEFDISESLDKEDDISYLLDIYLGSIEFVDGHNYGENSFVSFEDHSAEYQRIYKKVYDSILKQIGDISDVQSLKITPQGILEIKLQDDKQIRVNLINEWNDFLDESQASVRQETREQNEELQKEVARESFYGGAVEVEYLPGIALVGFGAAVAAENAKKIIQLPAAAGEKLVTLKSLVINTASGKKIVTLEQPIVGPQSEISKGIVKVLQREGYVVDVAKGLVREPVLEALEEVQKKLKSSNTYEEYEAQQKREGRKVEFSKEEFDRLKTTTIEQLDGALKDVKMGVKSSKAVLNFLKEVLPLNFGSAFFWPTFFIEARKTQTPIALLLGFGDAVLFHLGAKGGSMVTPGLLKPIGAIVGGGALVTGRHVLGDVESVANTTLNKKWLYTQKANYSDGRSRIVHAVTGLGIGEISDGAQGYYQDAREGLGLKETAGVDIGIPRTEVRLPFDLPYIGSYLFTIPEITFFQHKISMGTSPYSYLSGGADRRIYDWNKQVDFYVNDLTEDIYDLLGKYIRNESMFNDRTELESMRDEKINPPQTLQQIKDALFKKHLISILTKEETDSTFQYEMNGVVDGIMRQLPNITESNIPNNRINEIISTNVNAMKIDDLYVANQESQLALQRTSLDSMLPTLSDFVDEATMQYIETFPTRMIENRQLYENSTEEKMYKVLLNDTHEMVVDGQKIEVRYFVSRWLEGLASWKKEMYFINQIKGGNNRGYNWTWTL